MKYSCQCLNKKKNERKVITHKKVAQTLPPTTIHEWNDDFKNKTESSLYRVIINDSNPLDQICTCTSYSFLRLAMLTFNNF